MSKSHAVFPRGYRTGRYFQAAIFRLATHSGALRALFFELPPTRFRMWFVARYYHRLMEELERGDFSFMRAVEPNAALTMFLETYVGREAWQGALTNWLASFETARFELVEFISTRDSPVLAGLYVGGEGATSGLLVEDHVYFVGWVERGYVTRAVFTEQRSKALEAAGLVETQK